MLQSSKIYYFQDTWQVDHSVAFEAGASLADNYGTALLGLHHRADISTDSTVLVTAAAGGLGLAAVDVAANVYKAKVGKLNLSYL